MKNRKHVLVFSKSLIFLTFVAITFFACSNGSYKKLRIGNGTLITNKPKSINLEHDSLKNLIEYSLVVDYSKFSSRRARYILAFNSTLLWRSKSIKPERISDSLGLITLFIPKQIIINQDSISLLTKLKIPTKGINDSLFKETFEILKTMSFTEFKFESKPKGASIYLIPLLVWLKSNEDIQKIKLDLFLLHEGSTNLKTYLPEENYKAVFKLGNKVIVRDCKPIRRKPINQLAVDFETGQ